MDYLIPNSPPAGVLAAFKTFDLFGLAHLFKHLADHVKADLGALLVKLGDMERLPEAGDGLAYGFGLLAQRERGALVTVFKFLIEVLKRIEQIIDVRPRVVSAFVPAL